MAIVILYRKLSKNEKSEDAIPRSHSETNARFTDLSIIFLALFIPWNHLLSIFLVEDAILLTYKNFAKKYE